MAKKEDKKFIEQQIPVQDRPPLQSSGTTGGFRGFPKPLKTTKSFKQKQAAKEKIKREVSSAKFGTPTRFFKTAEKFGTTPKSKRATLDTGKVKGKKPKTGKPTIPPRQLAAQRRIQTINQQVKNATEQFPNPTGVSLKNKAAIVGNTVVTTTTAGTIVKLTPELLPDYELNKIKVLPDEKDELQIQKVIEQQQTLTPDEISDLAVKTKALPKVAPTQPQTDVVTPTKPKETTMPKAVPTEETLIGTQEDVELDEPELDEVELTDPNKEITPVPVTDPNVVQAPDTVEIDTDIVPAPAPDFEPLTEPVTEPLQTPLAEPVSMPKTELAEPSTAIQTETLTEPQPETLEQPLQEPFDSPTQVETKVATQEDDFGTVVTPTTAATRSNKKDKKKKETKTPKAIIPKKKKNKSQFRTKNGLKPTVTNFKTRKSSFQSNNVTGDIFKAPKGTEFDTNAGFREDSFKAIKFADKKLKFKNRKDVLVAAEKKGLI
tara:strand:+ start:2049 stop:3515 length:1467 start_codon:yes stop_codon:yes gene_type:complete